MNITDEFANLLLSEIHKELCAKIGHNVYGEKYINKYRFMNENENYIKYSGDYELFVYIKDGYVMIMPEAIIFDLADKNIIDKVVDYLMQNVQFRSSI